MKSIAFNIPHISPNSELYLKQALLSGSISGDGPYTKKCHAFLEQRYGFKKALLTTSCTDALEMAAILLDIRPGDEVIAPSFTFVSTVNAFVLRGARIVFCDSSSDHPNIDPAQLEVLITKNTKAIVVVHYAGVACDMDAIMAIARKHQIPVVEDAAQAIDSFYKGKPLGSIGTFGTFSFHATKNISCGEGGALVINDDKFNARAEVIREKGTNRSAFFRGEIDKYGWVDVGSSFLPSDLNAALLFSQLEDLESIQQQRLTIWKGYHDLLSNSLVQKFFALPTIPGYATNNAHMYFMVARNGSFRDKLLKALKEQNIGATFHYQSLHRSIAAKNFHTENTHLAQSDMFTENLLRLPLHTKISPADIERICGIINDVCEEIKK